ncbi:MAG TPA: L-threonylcarbamoyladenylate synthase [Sedimentisphaerales bacterium]|nr:L-threonylcarbamoyladenylate synthase [Sedimentisphaerales bacterium]
METEVLKIDSSRIDLAEIGRAARLIDAGELVGFPTETVYGIACRVETGSLAGLSEAKGRALDKPFTLHIAQRDTVRQYIPTMGIRAEKLIAKAWPGPLTIIFELEAADLEKQRQALDAEIFRNLYKDSSIGVRCPDNAVAGELLCRTKSPVVAPSANIAGQPPATQAQQVLSQFAGRVRLLLDGGPCRYGKSSTVVRLAQNGLEFVRDGVYSRRQVEEMAKTIFLFVCTGNTCRSPMAEALFSHYLAEKLNCEVDQLECKGYKIVSAGTAGVVGFAATPEAAAACAAKGIDITGHRAKGLSVQLIDEADYIFAMSGQHIDRIVGLSGRSAGKCRLLAENMDIHDPIGQPQSVYNNCAQLIEQAVRKKVGGLVL